ncbi:unnamed protein product [Lymnaea stagnalis]|uniref:G-protein coupled receptors family 1 profile domain-containing protein n=1 Tax=Lymnaea stagnalis TaxID=6523 RepID=A0AAV2HMB1_LYMST
MFYDISTISTTYIAVQRGCCVALPFHFRDFFTKERVIAGVIFIYVSGMACYVPVFATSLLLPARDSQTNATQVRLVFSSGSDKILAAVDILKKFALTFAGEFLALLSLMAIVIGMKSASEFRHASSHTGCTRDGNVTFGGTNQRDGDQLHRTDTAPAVSKSQRKEKKIVRQVLLITTVFIVCNTPQMVASIVGRVVPGVDLFGHNRNVYFLTYTVVNVFELFNSSFNFFIYYKFNTKFKEIVDDALCN